MTSTKATLPTKATAASAVSALAATPPATIHELGWWMPLFLFIGGWITYLFRTNNTAFEIGALVGSLVVVRSVYLLIFSCQDVRLTWVTSCGLLLGYAVGTLNTAGQLAKKELILANHVMRLQEDLSVALSLVLWVSATLFLSGLFLEKPIRVNPAKLVKSDLSYVVLALMVYFLGMATHQISYGGGSVSDSGHVTVIATIAGLVGPTLPALTVVLRKTSKLLSRTVPLWSLLAVELGMLIPTGRRVVIYSVLCMVFAFTLSGDRWKAPIWKKALTLAIVGAGLYSANLFFYAMRHEVEVNGAAKKVGGSDMKLTDILRDTTQFLMEGRSSDFDEEFSNNLQDRTFVLKYFSDLVAQSRTHPALHGRLLAFTVGMATPSAIYSLFGSKDEIIALGMEEVVANPEFGLLPVDEANSLMTAGISDFGMIGTFLYPIAIPLLFSFLIRVCMARSPEFMRFIATMLALWALFQTEMAVTGLVVLMRNTIILLLVWGPMEMAIRSSSSGPRTGPGIS